MQESTHFNNECGHMMFCDECANVAQNQYNVKQCPSCRVPIEKICETMYCKLMYNLFY